MVAFGVQLGWAMLMIAFGSAVVHNFSYEHNIVGIFASAGTFSA